MKKMLGTVLAISVLLSGCAADRQLRADSQDQDHVPTITARIFSDLPESDADERMDIQGYSAAPAQISKSVTPEAVEEPLYVRFVPVQQFQKKEDGNLLFVGRTLYPQFSDLNTDRWLQDQITQIRETAEREVAATRQQAVEDSTRMEGKRFYAYSHYADIQVSRMDYHVISLLQMDSVYSGGPHPNNLQRAYNLDLSKQKQLSLKDVLKETAVDQMLQRTLEKLESQMKTLYPNYPEVVSKQFQTEALTDNWYFSPGGLTIYFNCYDIAPYAAGVIKVEFPYQELTDVLKPEYLPQPHTEAVGKPVWLSDPAGKTVLAAPKASQNSRGYLSTDGVLADVRIYQLNGWMSEEAPLVGNMVFAANRLTWEDAVELSFPEQTEYLLVYTGEQCSKYTQVISSDGLRRIPNGAAYAAP